MNILAFDTCFSACSVAARSRGGAIASEHLVMDTGHAEALMPMIERVMAQAGIAFADLDRIIVTNGPGTFTGVRTGVAAARALSLVTRAEIVAVSSLWAIAMGAVEALDGQAATDGILVAMDARKGQFYTQVVDLTGHEVSPPQLLSAEDAAALCPTMRLVVEGNGAEAVAAAANAAGRFVRRGARPELYLTSPDARHLLAAADRSPMPGPILPLYLRPPDAKPQADKSLPWSSR